MEEQKQRMEADPNIMPHIRIIDFPNLLKHIISNSRRTYDERGAENMLSRLQEQDLSGMSPTFEDHHEL